MDDNLSKEEARAGDRVIIGLLLVFTSPWWLGLLLHYVFHAI